MSNLDRRNFENGQIRQPVGLAANVASSSDSSHGYNLARNGTKAFNDLPSPGHVLAGASSEQFPVSKSSNPIDGGVIQSEGSCRFYSLDEVLKATLNFHDALVIGIGGFGKVYKGFMDDTATMVAIKRLNAESKQGAGEFWTEVKMLSKIQHANLVALIGYCTECEEMILVYEYIARGTLADHLYKLNTTKGNLSVCPLPWEQRLNICIGAARGLDHLHSGTGQSFIHRDVKSTNILIDENWVAKISDFGLSRGTTSHSITHISTDVKGTFGYLDPDYFITQRLTTKSDVYAFGVVLLEVLCGRPPVDTKLDEDKISLVNWAQQCIKTGKLEGIINPSLIGQVSPRCLKSFVELANNCLHKSPKPRPTMAEVLGRLELALLSQLRGRTKGVMGKAFQSMMGRWLRERKDNSSSSGESNDSPRESNSKIDSQLYRQFSLIDILLATSNFSTSFLVRNSDKVYKGSVNTDGKALVVAIKRFKTLEAFEDVIDPKKQFLHPNILPPIGFCTERDGLILVHDYMANGSLQDHLYHTETPLSWEMRLRICIGAARGLRYHHANVERKLIPRYIEPSSILLDGDWVAKVMLPNTRTTTNISGDILSSATIRHDSVDQDDDLYLFISYRDCYRDCVYSLGVMLLEVLTCNKELGRYRNRKYRDVRPLCLLNAFLQSEKNICEVRDIGKIGVDRHLIGKIRANCLGKFLCIIESCWFPLMYSCRETTFDCVAISLQEVLDMQVNG